LIINALMGNHRWILRHLYQLMGPDERLLEIGSGDGSLVQKIDRLRIPTRPSLLSALDHVPAPVDLPDSCIWHQADVFDRLNIIEDSDLLVASLFLHHFEPDELARIGRSIARGPRVVLACEPVRRPIHKSQLLALRIMRLHPVTRHDACVSIEAGFRGAELPSFLNLDSDRWQITLSETLFGAYRMLAIRQ
jgi:hypothetical protein